MRWQLDSLTLALPLTILLGHYIRVLRSFLAVYSVSLGFPPLPIPALPLVNCLQQYSWTHLLLPKAHWFRHDLGVENMYI